MKIYYVIIACTFLLTNWLQAQTGTDSLKTIQFSGVVITEDQNQMVPLPYTNIAVEGTTRGTSTDQYGFFSLVAQEGESIIFSRIGYKDVRYIIPDTLDRTMYSVFQIMTEDTLLLPETVIYPWPSKEHFEIEFLAIDVHDELEKAARENLAPSLIEAMRKEYPVDGTEASKVVIASQAADFKYSGQFKPQNYLNPFAWKKFIDAWRRGDFKRKK